MSGYEELLALADAATPGEWFAASDNKRRDGIALVGLKALRGQGERGCIAVLAGSGDAIRDRHANAAFIAAANPTAVKGLVEEVLALRGKVERVKALADDWLDATCITDGAPCSFHRHADGYASDLRAALGDPA